MSDFKTQLNKLRFKVNNLGGEYTCLRVTGRLNNQRFVAYFTHITPEDIMLLLNHQYADEHLTVETIDNLELKKLEFI